MRNAGSHPALHYTEDEAAHERDLDENDLDITDPNDETSADSQSYFTPEEQQAQVNAMTTASTLPCHSTLTTGHCSKAGCPFSHSAEVLTRHHEKMIAALRKPA